MWSDLLPKPADDRRSPDICLRCCRCKRSFTGEREDFTTFPGASEDPFFREDPLHAVFMDLLPVSHTRPPIPAGSMLWDLLFTAFRDEIPHGKKTPEQALTEIDEQVNAPMSDELLD